MFDDIRITAFWGKVDKSPGHGPNGDCWIWRGTRHRNYGVSRIVKRQTRPAHRVSYELNVGPIPDGLVIDHHCVNPPCVNPSHLEAVSNTENLLRGKTRQTHCRSGHPLSGENLKLDYRGRRICQICYRESLLRSYAKKRAERVRKVRPKNTASHCKYGHEYTSENAIFNPKGSQYCRTCRNISRMASRRAARKAEQALNPPKTLIKDTGDE